MEVNSISCSDLKKYTLRSSSMATGSSVAAGASSFLKNFSSIRLVTISIAVARSSLTNLSSSLSVPVSKLILIRFDSTAIFRCWSKW